MRRLGACCSNGGGGGGGNLVVDVAAILAGGWGFNPGAGVMNEGTALGP